MGRSEEEEFLYLTTTGRRSGVPREIEIWFTQVDGRYDVIAEHGARAHWVRNLLADPRGLVRVGEASVAAVSRVVDPAAEADLQAAVQGRSREKYGSLLAGLPGQGSHAHFGSAPCSRPDGIGARFRRDARVEFRALVGLEGGQ